MTIQLELNSEAAAQIAAEATARGITSEEYVGKLLREALARASRRTPLTLEKFHGMLRALAKGAERLPDLPTETFTRESFYADRIQRQVMAR